jgi:hypothetical protein
MLLTERERPLAVVKPICGGEVESTFQRLETTGFLRPHPGAVPFQRGDLDRCAACRSLKWFVRKGTTDGGNSHGIFQHQRIGETIPKRRRAVCSEKITPTVSPSFFCPCSG